MKVSRVLAPLVALTAVLSWNVIKHREVVALEDQTRLLREKIATAESTADHQLAADGRGSRTPHRPDWRKLARRAMELRNGNSAAGLKVLRDLENQVAEMSAAELLAALEDVAALGLNTAQRAKLEEMLVAPLIEQAPEQLLARFAARIGKDDDGVGWQLPMAMAGWAKQDPAAATAWMDRQIAEGAFDSKSLDGRSQTRLEFEGALAASLLEQAGMDVAGRIAALPEEQRREVL